MIFEIKMDKDDLVERMAKELIPMEIAELIIHLNTKMYDISFTEDLIEELHSQLEIIKWNKSR